MIRLAVRCRAELAERVLAELLELVPGGVEEVGPVDGGRYEYAVYGPPGELPALPDLDAAAGEGLVEVSSTVIPDDWADRWRDFHRPASIAGGRIVVRPSWWKEARPTADPAGANARADQDGPSRRRGQGVLAGAEDADHRGGPGREAEEAPRLDLIVDPGQAFGTGAHATTRMCLELLLELAEEGRAGGPLADLGTGSGVLAIAAAKLGWNPVRGCDSEPAALEAAARNATANGVELGLERLDLRRRRAPTAPTMIANLTAPLLAAVASRLTEPPRSLICSGLLAAEAGAARAALAGADLEAVAERESGEWTALLCRPRRRDRG